MISVVEMDKTKTHSGLPAPDDWHIVERREDGLMWERITGQKITVIESTSVRGGNTWLHVSVAKPNRKMPTYDDIQEARKLFVGEHRECYSIYPPAERYVNFAHVLHLFCCLDAPDGVLPHMEDEVAPGVLGV